MMFICCVADLYIAVNYKYEYTKKVFNNYIVENAVDIDFAVTVTDEMINYEIEVAKEGLEDKTVDIFPSSVENTAIFRRISSELMKNYDGLLFHSSAISYNGNAYLFAAKSGTGKSTHTNLLRKYNGEIRHINDDKPFLRYIASENKFYAYGSPWQGKHGRGENVKVPLKAICLLNRGETNSIEKINSLKCLADIMKQTVKPETEEEADAIFATLSRLVSTVDFYRLYCNMSDDAAATSFNGMIKG